ncbi:MAG TPA: energy-coupling factor transporter transmembrane protein EcfT [Alphaproteobacteria bacterium]|nr:energy-coupling factor transporter transmembrane protein EcfT [Alphaproteobacteria bacterium]
MIAALYHPGASPLHRAGAGVKLLGLAGIAAAAFLLPHPGAQAGLLALALAAWAACRLPARRLWGPGRGALLLAALILGVNWALGDPELGAAAALRFLALLAAALLVTSTTTVSAMTAALERALAPLRPLGVSPEGVALALSLAIRLIPLLMAEAGRVREAQRARGLDRSPVALFVPLVVRTLRIAEELAEALDARGHEPGRKMKPEAEATGPAAP